MEGFRARVTVHALSLATPSRALANLSRARRFRWFRKLDLGSFRINAGISMI